MPASNFSSHHALILFILRGIFMIYFSLGLFISNLLFASSFVLNGFVFTLCHFLTFVDCSALMKTFTNCDHCCCLGHHYGHTTKSWPMFFYSFIIASKKCNVQRFHSSLWWTLNISFTSYFENASSTIYPFYRGRAMLHASIPVDLSKKWPD